MSEQPPDDKNTVRDRDQDEHSRPGIPNPRQQPPDQEQPLRSPLQLVDRRPSQGVSSSQWIPPSTGNPDLDPVNLHQGQRIDLRDPNPLTPQGMLYDPRQLLDQQRRGSRPDGSIPAGARFDPFGPPDPDLVGPGRGPMPSGHFGVPDPDHMVPPGQPQPPTLGRGKTLKTPWPPRSGGFGGFPPPGGSGGSPFL